MVDQHARQHVPGLARVLGLLMLLAGIVAMHAGVFAVSSAAADVAPEFGHGAAMSASGAATVPGNVSEHVAISEQGAVSEHSASTMSAAAAVALPDMPDSTAAHHGSTNSAPSTDETHCGGTGCGGGHGGMHGCVFILVALALALALVLLYRIGGGTPGTGRARHRLRRPRRIRPPPWTVLSLAELSILRI